MTDSTPPAGPEPGDPESDGPESDDFMAELDEGDLVDSAEPGSAIEPGYEESQLPDELPPDASEADVAEQARSALPGTAREVLRHHLPAEANEADVREQDRIVDLDDEDER
ncbi:MAG: hypothetical protein ACXVHC_00890 [Frankiaceae bacterium]